MAEITTYKYRVEPQDVDFTLRASASSIVNYMLNVAGRDAHNKGFGVEVLQDSSLTWVLMRFAVEIESRPEQYADIEIDTWISDFNRLSSTRNFRMRIGDKVIASGVSQWCVLNMETRQAADMSMMKEAHDKFIVNEPSPLAAPARLRPIEATASISRPVVYSDIDFNRHMNTLRYVDLIFDAMPLELIEKNRGMRLDIHFLAEALYGDTLTVGYVSEGDVWQFEISANGEKTLCRARIELTM
jgi:acyl-ACP thioesterase